MEKFIKELLNFTRMSELNLDYFSIAQVLDESIKMVSDSLVLKNIHLEKSYQPHLPQVYVDGDKMRQVFLNILRNAYEAVEEGGEIRVSLSLLKERSGNKIRVNISDDGCGIPEKDEDVIFEPFYTTKSSGIGLGLANARKIVEQHKGSIRLTRGEGKGASFEIIIPYNSKK